MKRGLSLPLVLRPKMHQNAPMSHICQLAVQTQSRPVCSAEDISFPRSSTPALSAEAVASKDSN